MIELEKHELIRRGHELLDTLESLIKELKKGIKDDIDI